MGTGALMDDPSKLPKEFPISPPKPPGNFPAKLLKAELTAPVAALAIAPVTADPTAALSNDVPPPDPVDVSDEGVELVAPPESVTSVDPSSNVVIDDPSSNCWTGLI